MSGLAPVPFLDLAPMNRGLKEAVLAELDELIEAGAFTNGPQVAAFESDFAAYCGVRECVGTASGHAGLQLALLAAGLEDGDEVIVPAQTFVATFEAVTQAGGVPVPVDIGPLDYTIDVAAVEEAITPRTRFLLPVHLFGQMADVGALQALAADRDLLVVEDACQAHGASRDGVRAGAGGIAAAFSFYPAKNLGAFGDAGALVTNDPELAARARTLREHGQTSKYRHEREGYTARLDTVQALVLRRKLPFLDGWNLERRAAAAFYSASLAGIPELELPEVPPGSNPVWHLYVVTTPDPDSLADFLRARGIATGRHYPESPHLTGAYAYLGYEHASFPVAERLAAKCLSLPIFPGMSDEQLHGVVSAVRGYFGA